MRPRTAALSLMVLALLGVALTGSGRSTGRSAFVYSPFHRNDHNAIVRVRQSARRVALTFDDGPSPRWTPALIRLLAREGVRATFFVIGKRAVRHPHLISLERRHRHEIANHTFTHPNLTRLSRSAIVGEIQRGAKAIESVGSPAPQLFRPPLGAFDEDVGAEVAAHGELMVGWDLPLDRFVGRASARRGVRRLVVQVRPGSIVLIHAERGRHARRTLRAVGLLINELRADGYEPVTVRQLIDARA